jgi:hypothetical protein
MPLEPRLWLPALLTGTLVRGALPGTAACMPDTHSCVMAPSCSLTGTLVSGALYTYAGGDGGAAGGSLVGFAACFWASAGFAAISALIEVFLADNSGGLLCGTCVTLVSPPAGEKVEPRAGRVESRLRGLLPVQPLLLGGGPGRRCGCWRNARCGLLEKPFLGCENLGQTRAAHLMTRAPVLRATQGGPTVEVELE